MKFENKELGLSIETHIDNKQIIYFKGIDIASALGYTNTRKSLRDHVDDKYKVSYEVLSKRNKTFPFSKQHPETIFITEPGLYALIFSSKLDSAKVFQQWVFEKVLPSIRKYGSYILFNNRNSLTFKIENEYDLHTKVVSFIRRFYDKAIITAGLGELQDSSNKRIQSYKKGYTKGQPDLIIQNMHKRYSGMCIEFKTPLGNGVVSKEQKELLESYEESGYKCLISNDYDLIINEINDYMRDVRIQCRYCNRAFINRDTLINHKKWIHKIV